MDLLENPLRNRPIQTGREMSSEPYLNWQFGCIDNPDRQFGDSSVATRTRAQSDGPEPLIILDNRNTENDKEMNKEAEARKLHRTAKVNYFLEMWLGSQNLRATQKESRAQN